MKRNISLGIAAVAMVLTIAIGGTLAYFTDHDTAANVMTVGKVKIYLVEKTDTSGETEYTGGIFYSGIKPGDVVSKRPIVKVADDSEPAYIRVRVRASSSDPELSRHLYQLGYDTTGWKYVNGYYYYPSVVSAGSVLPVFTHVRIPADWGALLKGNSFRIDIYAEAVQAENFSPDFSSVTDPWHGVIAE